MKKDQIFLSTIAPDAEAAAKARGFGLEIAEYCTAWNMDLRFDKTHPAVEKKLDGIPCRLLHAPFNELFPCAIDPKARELAAFRYRQALELADTYGARKVIIHSGYYEKLYYPVWFTRESVKFWTEFMDGYRGSAIICLENVFEKDGTVIADIIRRVGDERFRMCLDTGHVNAYSPVPLDRWIDECADCISHFHVHNNDGRADTHCALDEGSIDMAAFFEQADRLCKEATYTLEVREAQRSCAFMDKLL